MLFKMDLEVCPTGKFDPPTKEDTYCCEEIGNLHIHANTRDKTLKYIANCKVCRKWFDYHGVIWDRNKHLKVGLFDHV